MPNHMSTSRRELLKHSLVLGSGMVTAPMTFWGQKLYAQSGGMFAAKGPAVSVSPDRPRVPFGVQLGDISATQVTFWSKADRPSQLMLELATRPDFRDARLIEGPSTLEGQDYAIKANVRLPPSQENRFYYRLSFRSLTNLKASSNIELGSFANLQRLDRDVSFTWSGDTAGQGWGINSDFGGMKIYQVMRQTRPDFFIHCGDYIYADGPIQPSVTLDDGSVWRNIVTDEKAKVAETLAEFRGNYYYNLLDPNVRDFNAEVPQLVQWDDHETLNNWYPTEILDDERYQVKSVALLAARAKQAFLEMTPISPLALAEQKIYRAFSYGPLLEVFMIDLRSYRGANSNNDQQALSGATNFFGSEQLHWLKQSLLHSSATWKVIASDMPIGLIVRDGEAFENAANGDGPARGRELEIADLLSFIKKHDIQNVVWLTADVHYAATHYYDPSKAVFQDFKPFYEFVSGPLHAGTFGPNELDNTFGPQVEWTGIPKDLKPNRPPSDGYQFFGHIQIDAVSKVMTVRQINIWGEELYRTELLPE